MGIEWSVQRKILCELLRLLCVAEPVVLVMLLVDVLGQAEGIGGVRQALRRIDPVELQIGRIYEAKPDAELRGRRLSYMVRLAIVGRR